MPTSGDRAALGRSGETLAAEFLVQHGYHLIGRNVRCRYGEIDILALHDGVLVVVEVKTRRRSGAFTPLDAVHPAKQATLGRLAAWVSSHYPDRSVQVDVVSVVLPANGEPEVVHLENVLA